MLGWRSGGHSSPFSSHSPAHPATMQVPVTYLGAVIRILQYLLLFSCSNLVPDSLPFLLKLKLKSISVHGCDILVGYGMDPYH